jgi:hypothetical protein
MGIDDDNGAGTPAGPDDEPCDHDFRDWSNAIVSAPFNVCHKCGRVEGSDLRIGASVAEFREYMKTHARN